MTNLIIRQSTPGSGRLEGTIGGFTLILTAVAAVAMVWTRLEASVDHPTLEAIFRAIDENSAMYNWHGTARLWFGGLLLASSYFIGPALVQARAIGLQSSRIFLTLAGIAMIVSGILTILLPSLIVFDDAFGTETPESIYHYRGLAGNIGNSLIGLAILSMALTQWRFGGLMKPIAALGIILGPTMLLVWWDAATISHRITGTGLLIWLLLTATALFIGQRDHKKSEQETTEPTQHFQVEDVN